jgi:hypothetical protein
MVVVGVWGFESLIVGFDSDPSFDDQLGVRSSSRTMLYVHVCVENLASPLSILEASFSCGLEP